MTPLIIIEFETPAFAQAQSERVETALVRALNRTAERARTTASREVRDQVAFPAAYVSPANKRLWVSQRANGTSLSATVEGRGRATSLARFSRQKPVAPGQRHKGGEVKVTVKPGVTKSISRAFLIRLNNDNIGLAVRTDGRSPAGAYRPKEIGKNLWLLYGPSVDQALIAASDGDGIFAQMSEQNLDILEAEYNRQMDLLEGKRA